MAEVESMNEGAQFGGVESTYIEAIDGPREGAESTESAAPEGETADTAEQSSEVDAAQEATEQPSYSKDPVINDLIANKFAKDHPELDPANPAHLKILTRLANQEKYIRGLKAKVAPDRLTDYERSVLYPKEETAPAAAQPQTQQPQPLSDTDDIGALWKRPEDAYSQLAQAWSKEGGPDLATVNKIELGVFQRRASALGYMTADQAQQFVDKAIQERLGDVLPGIRETVAMQQSQANKQFALADLSKSSEWADIAELEVVDNPEPLIFVDPRTGQEERVENSPLNRIIADHPEILDITILRNGRGQLLSKDDSEKLTYEARFRAAGRISKQGQIDNGKAKQILAAGQKQAERENGDRVRQGLNGGKGATVLPNGKKTGSLVHELVNDGGPRSFSSL